jgi:hypothetical protein
MPSVQLAAQPDARSLLWSFAVKDVAQHVRFALVSRRTGSSANDREGPILLQKAVVNRPEP